MRTIILTCLVTLFTTIISFAATDMNRPSVAVLISVSSEAAMGEVKSMIYTLIACQAE